MFVPVPLVYVAVPPLFNDSVGVPVTVTASLSVTTNVIVSLAAIAPSFAP